MADHHQQRQKKSPSGSTGGGRECDLPQGAGGTVATEGYSPPHHHRGGAARDAAPALRPPAQPPHRQQQQQPPPPPQPRRSLRSSRPSDASSAGAAPPSTTSLAAASSAATSRTRRRGDASSPSAGLLTVSTTTTAAGAALAPTGILMAPRPTKKARPLVTSFSQLPDGHGPAPEDGGGDNADADGASLTRRSYNLRASTMARSFASRSDAAAPPDAAEGQTTAGAAVITPRTPAAARQLGFAFGGAPSPAEAAAQQQGDEPSEEGSGTTILPPGVVNIYHRSKSSTLQSCACLWNRCVAVDTSLGFSHIANYGEVNGEVLREAEARQVEAIRRLLPLGSPDSSTVDTNSEFDDEDEEEEDSVEHHGVRSRPLSRLSAHSNRRLNLQETFGAAGGEAQREGGGPVAARERERPHPASSRNMASEAMVRQPYLSPKMRSILIHWMVEVGQEYKVSDAAFHLSVSLLDHLLLKGPTKEELEERDEKDDARGDPWFLVQRSDFQAVGCACAWIASKLEDKNAPSVDDFVWIADYSFSCNRLRALEEQVCRELEFRLSCITPHHFVNLFLRASNACPNGTCEFDHPVLRQVVLYLLALGRLSYHLSLCKPSLLAAAAVYLARATVGIREADPAHAVHPEGYWTRTLEFYTTYEKEDLRSAVLIIHRYQLVAETAENIKGLFTKFSKSSHHYASLKTAVRVEDLGFETPLTHDSMEFQAIADEPI